MGRSRAKGVSPAAIFLSYRRKDSEYATAGLHRSLGRAFGPSAVFVDRAGLLGGDDLRPVLTDKVRDAKVTIAVIGPNWLEAQDDEGCRWLDKPSDYVRLELGTAYAAGRLVIPVLVSGAQLPDPTRLPPNVEALGRSLALELRVDVFKHDVAKLVAQLRQQVDDRRPWWRRFADAQRGRTGRLVVASAVILSALIAAAVATVATRHPSAPPPAMSGDLNIAVSPFNTHGDATESATLAGLSTGLVSSLAGAPADAGLTHEAILLDDRTPVSTNTDDDRRVAATQAAERVNAHVVIYGTVVDDKVQPWFVVASAVVRDAPELVGPYELGAPFDATDTRFPEGTAELREDLTERVTQLLLFADGLALLRTGQLEAALAIFAALDRTSMPYNPALADLFAGTAALLSRDLDTADAWYQRALAHRPGYDRAELGLAEVARLRARWAMLAAVGARRRLSPPQSKCWRPGSIAPLVARRRSS